jgi:aminopeptidase N
VENWRHYTPALQTSIRKQLERIGEQAKLSPDVAEIIDKAQA